MKLSRAFTLGLSALMGNRVDAYWWNAAPNAGDEVTPFLLKALGFTPVHTWKDQAEVIACGSVLQKLSPDYSGYILGAGLLNRVAVPALPRAQIAAVRGEYTKEALGISSLLALGDPGLLVSRYLPGRPTPGYRLGIIPHFREKDHPSVRQLCARYRGEVLFIDIQHGIHQVIRQMLTCDAILSSSLHGVVFADAYGIPSAWYTTQNVLSDDGKFKYLDYYSAFQRAVEPVTLTGLETIAELAACVTTPDAAVVGRIQDELQAVYQRFALEQYRRRGSGDPTG